MREERVEVATTTSKMPQPRLRADALRNRERIIAAAREMMAELGADVPLDEIARRAGVGNATLYRHFVDRFELIHHVTLSVMSRTAATAESVLVEESDAFQALRRFAHAAVGERIGALCPLLSDSFEAGHPELLAARERLEAAVGALMAAARESGRLRPDVAVGDLMVAITQLTRPLPGHGCIDFDKFVHRHLELFLDGLAAPARSQLPGAAATLADFRRH
ncbi:TetR/AcrR family transcriptional regulator [Streptomyces sp. MST-110588]|uniref:TetR/AcrR family transcriptional regulator n=1 Tax=Streptomyces sp. MST-110588 TaxID=2833628 RepID=UPI001F5D3B3A|nr:TetR/AcrR family transcriptional regulator [Streptomyces sp. MST-110588]UNO41494.1 TetR/AcrR family transcriptional regulator [Streptomyces sp. MST-110588]